MTLKNLRFLFLGQNLLPLWAPPGVEPVAQSDSKREKLQGPNIWTLRFRKFFSSPTFAKKYRKYFFQSDSLLSRNSLDRARLPTRWKKSINAKIVWRKCITHIKATTVRIWIYLVSWCAQCVFVKLFLHWWRGEGGTRTRDLLLWIEIANIWQSAWLPF